MMMKRSILMCLGRCSHGLQLPVGTINMATLVHLFNERAEARIGFSGAHHVGDFIQILT
jgi:hypothetical protein